MRWLGDESLDVLTHSNGWLSTKGHNGWLRTPRMIEDAADSCESMIECNIFGEDDQEAQHIGPNQTHYPNRNFEYLKAFKLCKF